MKHFILTPLLSSVVLALVMVSACGNNDNASKAGPTQTASTSSAPAAKPPAARKASEKIQGTWNIVLGDDEKRQVEVLKLALKDPAPTEVELTAAKLNDDEKMMVSLLGAARAKNPSDPKIKKMQAAADGLGQATVQITATGMTFTAGTVKEDSTYTVDSETDNVVKVSSTLQSSTDGSPTATQHATLTLTSDDTLEMVDDADATKKQVFARKK
ncbi:MAG: hypothetical protein GXP62_19805 [Oligoflexia bacterium]|nr:hypothetical protein [Oligoflexia bacterium]